MTGTGSGIAALYGVLCHPTPCNIQEEAAANTQSTSGTFTYIVVVYLQCIMANVIEVLCVPTQIFILNFQAPYAPWKRVYFLMKLQKTKQKIQPTFYHLHIPGGTM
jgi:hypothetical protein